jgi:hypothetical protein
MLRKFTSAFTLLFSTAVYAQKAWSITQTIHATILTPSG